MFRMLVKIPLLAAGSGLASPALAAKARLVHMTDPPELSWAGNLAFGHAGIGLAIVLLISLGLAGTSHARNFTLPRAASRSKSRTPEAGTA